MGSGTVAVLGAGLMGRGIAQVCAAAGFAVHLYDSNPAQLKAAMDGIRGSLRRLREKGVIDERQEAGAGRISTSADIGGRIDGGADDGAGGIGDAGVVIEAIVEDADAKKRLYGEVGGHLRDGAILATNTSSCCITELAGAAPAAERFVGMHFMNPVPLMKLVEVIPGALTSEETVAKTEALARKLGKETVRSDDSPGFVTNRLLMPLINEAIFALHENLASAEDIDRAMKLGMNHPMGPLQLADFIGLDTVLAVLEVLHKGIGDPKFRPCPLLKKMVAAGSFGKKSGRGFYQY